jgi:hypothetical protein
VSHLAQDELEIVTPGMIVPQIGSAPGTSLKMVPSSLVNQKQLFPFDEA